MAQPIGKGQAGGGIPQQKAQDNSATTRAVSNLGGAIAQTGKLAEQMQAEKDRQQLGEVEMEMKKQSGALQVKLARAANPEDHLQIANDHFRAAEDKILNGKDYSRKFRNDLSRRVRMYSATQIEKIGTDAKLMQISNGRQIHNARIEARLADNLPEEAIAMVREGAGTYYTDEMGEIKIDKIKRRLRNEEYQSEVRAGNPEFFDQDLPIADSDKARFRKQAESQQASLEREDLSMIGDAIEIKDITTRDELEEALDGAPHVSDLMKQKALQNWDNSQPLSYEEEKEVLDQLNELFSQSPGALDREEYAKKHHQLTSQIHSLMGREGSRKLLSRASATQVDNWIKGEGMPVDESLSHEIEREVLNISDAGHLGRTESIDKGGEMGVDKIRSIREERDAINDNREFIEAQVKEYFKTQAGREEYAKDEKKAVQRKVAEVAAGVLTGEEVDRQDQESDQSLYDEVVEIEDSGAVDDYNGPSVLPRKGFIETEYELNDKGGFSPRIGTDLEGNPIETYIDESGVFRAK